MTHITLGCRLMAGQRILVPSMGVRLPPSQPLCAVFYRLWPVRLAVQDAALSRRRSPVRIRYGLPRVSEALRASSHMARSSSGSGRRPLKAEITSSNLVRATKTYPRVFELGVFCLCAYLSVATCLLVVALLGSCFEIAYGIQPFDEVERNKFIVNLRPAIGIRRLVVGNLYAAVDDSRPAAGNSHAA